MKLRGRSGVEPAKEQPSLYCVDCRRWIETREIFNMFASVDGKTAVVGLWRCPACRGEVPPEAVHVARAPTTQADLARDDRRGPLRRIVEVLREGAKTTQYARLECGHEGAVPRGATEYRCRKCRPSAGETETK